MLQVYEVGGPWLRVGEKIMKDCVGMCPEENEHIPVKVDLRERCVTSLWSFNILLGEMVKR